MVLNIFSLFIGLSSNLYPEKETCKKSVSIISSIFFFINACNPDNNNLID